ncbi:MAG: ComF family protein [Oscillospiraceae bacterium]|nr:ComF family protein [Oscillospiraceae bacterium]
MKADFCRRILAWIIDALFPLRCPFCGDVIDRNAECCEVCFAKLPFADLKDSCTRCGKRECVCGSVPLITMTRPVFYYEELASHAVLRMKFAHRPGTAIALGRFMADAVQKEGGSWDMIVPVPMTKRKVRRRGYNQSELLGRSVAERLNIPLNTALRKTRETKAQHTLDEQERAKNLLGAYQADPALVQGKRVLLCDDVLTTGATLKEGAKALLQAGASEVGAVVLCCVERNRV